MRLPIMLRSTHNRILQEETKVRLDRERFYQRAIRELQQTQQRPQRAGVVLVLDNKLEAGEGKGVGL